MLEAFFEELEWRGMVQDTTPEIKENLAKEMVCGYVGFDPTASSLHIGNLATVMLLVHLQRAGHKPLVVLGGATGMIGDPSGKSQERKLLTLDVIEENTRAIEKQLRSFLTFENIPNNAEIVNNYDWTRHFTLLDFLRDVGKHITVNYMMSKESVQQRLENGISFTEFSYQLLQGYDFYYLFKTKNCKLQMGGSDQWGNITTGTELIRRIEHQSAMGLTCPLIKKADGTKFGKSEGGNIWLDAAMTSPYKFYQFWLNVADEDIDTLIKVFSLKSKDEVLPLLEQHKANPGARAAQKVLAEELTVRIHGAEALEHVLKATEILFGKATQEALADLADEQFLEIFEGVPQAGFEVATLDSGISLLDLMVQLKAAPSKSEARKLIQGGGVQVNKTKMTDINATLNRDNLLNDKRILLQVGKKNYFIASFE